MSHSHLPTRRLSLIGTDLDDNRVELKHTISKKLYRCPGCGESISIGAEHVLVRIQQPDRSSYHQHWHRDCTRKIVRELRGLRARPV
jgi:hypothetical protein